MRILLTNNTLDVPGGSERYIEEICLHLLKTGHIPIAYSSRLGIVAENLSEKGILIVDDLRQLTAEPDAIHSHHHLDAAYATTYFPWTPCVHFCHGIIPWEEHCIPNSSQIYQFVAVSDLTAEKLMCCNIPPEKITVIPNWAASKFKLNSSARSTQKDKYGSREIKALILANNRHKFDKEIESACHASGISLDKAGASYNTSTTNPEELIKDYDIVFCYGKSAMESLWAGAEVITSCDQGFGGLVTDENFDFYKSRNFGYTTCLNSITPEEIDQILQACIARIKSGERCHLSFANQKKLDPENGLTSIAKLLAAAAASRRPPEKSIDAENFLQRSRCHADYIRFVQRTRMYRMPILEQKNAEAEIRANHAEQKLLETEQKLLETEQKLLEAEQKLLETEQTKDNILTSRNWRYSRKVRVLIGKLWTTRP